MHKYIGFALLAVFSLTPLMGCRDSNIDTGKTTIAEMEHTERNQSRLLKSQPPPHLKASLERANLINYLSDINKEDRISYIYLINYGKVMAHYTLKGKVTYCSSKLTTRDQIMSLGNTASHFTRHVIESPGLDGSYGPSEDAIFFYTTEGILIQWKGDYLWSFEPLKLTTPPQLVRQIK